MKKPIKITLAVVGLLVVILVLLNVINTDVHVERTATINTDLSTLQAEVTDFRKFQTWSPWAKMDPNASAEFKGPQGAVGAEFHWSGNEEVGTGFQKVTTITPQRIDLDLVFTAPWQSESIVYYEFTEQQGNQTQITWGYDGDMPLMASLFVDMDEMLGAQYEKGLKDLQKKFE